jgi:gamma-glutamyl:cysteine ligase YbdK (ATP-grasp superfamily)
MLASSFYMPQCPENRACPRVAQGVHYGTFTGKVSDSGMLESVWVVLRPHNWHPKSTVEVLLELDSETGK